MYKKIEDFYKNNCIYNKLLKKIFTWYLVLFFAFSFFGFFKASLLIIVFFVIMCLIIKNIYQKELGIFISLKSFCDELTGETIGDIIDKRDIELFREFLIKNNMYDLKLVDNFVQHYVALNVASKKDENFISILSIILSIIGFIFNKDEAIFYGIITLIFYCILYWSFKQFGDLIKSVRGEKNMNLRLEEIFSIISCELVVEKSTKKSSKNTSIKVKKKKK